MSEESKTLRITLYAHVDRDHAWDKGAHHGLGDEALSMFKYAGEEHEMEYAVDPNTGEATLVKVDGRLLVPSVEEQVKTVGDGIREAVKRPFSGIPEADRTVSGIEAAYEASFGSGAKKQDPEK